FGHIKSWHLATEDILDTKTFAVNSHQDTPPTSLTRLCRQKRFNTKFTAELPFGAARRRAKTRLTIRVLRSSKINADLRFALPFATW
ncbi:hypothetical protein ABTL48_20460, partial [Acinetobacter baumannii]